MANRGNRLSALVLCVFLLCLPFIGIDSLAGLIHPMKGRHNWKNRTASLGILIGEKDYQGRGFGPDAVRTMLKFAFDELNLHRVELDVMAFNTRAIRCYEKVGFRHEGIRRESFFRGGKYHDLHVMAVLRKDFHALSDIE